MCAYIIAASRDLRNPTLKPIQEVLHQVDAVDSTYIDTIKAYTKPLYFREINTMHLYMIAISPVLSGVPREYQMIMFLFVPMNHESEGSTLITQIIF